MTYAVFILLSARVSKVGIYPVLVTQATYVAPDISSVSKSYIGSMHHFEGLNKGLHASNAQVVLIRIKLQYLNPLYYTN